MALGSSATKAIGLDRRESLACVCDWSLLILAIAYWTLTVVGHLRCHVKGKAHASFLSRSWGCLRSGQSAADRVARDEPGAATSEGAVISNGVVQLGVTAAGALNYDCAGAGDAGCPPPSVGGVGPVGLRLVSDNLESTAPGCLCEGWGVADAGSGLTGSADGTPGFQHHRGQLHLAESRTGISTVTIADPAIPGFQMQVTQDYHPSLLSDNLYEDR